MFLCFARDTENHYCLMSKERERVKHAKQVVEFFSQEPSAIALGYSFSQMKNYTVQDTDLIPFSYF